MSNAACIQFKSDDEPTVTLYLHDMSDPDYLSRYLSRTLNSRKTWSLPRFEPTDFAAGFCGEIKHRGGLLRIVDRWNRYTSIDWLYTLSCNNSVLIIKVEAVEAPRRGETKPSRWARATSYYGPLHYFISAEGDCSVANDFMRSRSNAMHRSIKDVNRQMQSAHS
jgi:hypothetical protein